MITLVDGMCGLGDNIYQRAVLKRLLLDGPVYLRTPWPELVADLVRK